MGVDFVTEGNVAYITLNRPDAMNSLDRKGWCGWRRSGAR